MRVWQQILEFITLGETCAMISVVQVAGSTPREVGASIVINKKGKFHGTIGGGNMENSSIAQALEMLKNMRVSYRLKKHLLGPDMGQCCGGAVSVLIEVFTKLDIELVKNFATLEAKQKINILTKLNGASAARHCVEIDEDATLGLNGDEQVLMQYGKANTPVYMFGAGHVGKAIMLQMATLPFDVTWVDNRKSEFPKYTPENFTMICVNAPEQVLAAAPINAHILILTHDHELDFKIAMAALLMNRFAYVGMIGSKTKRARFTSRFKKAGLSEQEILRMSCPIGIEGIKSKKPVAIAISVVAEFLTRITI